MCLQETQWVGEQSREIEHTGYKLWYTGKDKNRNGIGKIIDKSLENEVVRLRGWGIEFCYSGTILTKQISTLLEKWIVDVEKIVRYIKRERE